MRGYIRDVVRDAWLCGSLDGSWLQLPFASGGDAAVPTILSFCYLFCPKVPAGVILVRRGGGVYVCNAPPTETHKRAGVPAHARDHDYRGTCSWFPSFFFWVDSPYAESAGCVARERDRLFAEGV